MRWWWLIVYCRMWWVLSQTAPPLARIGGTPRQESADEYKSRCNNMFLSVWNMFVLA